MEEAKWKREDKSKEGYERSSKKEFTYFLNIAKGSVGELRSQLIIAHELGIVKTVDFEELLSKCKSLSKQLKGFIKHLENK